MKIKKFYFLLLLLGLVLMSSTSLAIVNTILRGNIDCPIGPELVLNGGFEDPGIGPPFNIFEYWTSFANSGVIAQTFVAEEVHRGLAAVRITAGPLIQDHVYSDAFEVVPGATYRYELWSRSEWTGGTEGRYHIYDWTNFAFIVPITGTGVTTGTYTLITGTFVAPPGCFWAGVYGWCSTTVGDIVWFDDYSVRQLY